MKFSAGLGNNFVPMRENQNIFKFVNVLLDDRSGDDRFSRSGRRDLQDPALACIAFAVERGNGFDLVCAQIDHVAPGRVRGHFSPSRMPL